MSGLFSRPGPAFGRHGAVAAVGAVIAVAAVAPYLTSAVVPAGALPIAVVVGQDLQWGRETRAQARARTPLRWECNVGENLGARAGRAAGASGAPWPILVVYTVSGGRAVYTTSGMEPQCVW